jgi:predicted aconitase with swiveling domain
MGNPERLIRGKPVVAGKATGEALVSSEPLSFWGGYDAATGEVIDRRHPLSGNLAAGKILIIPFTRGSSTTTAVLLESVRAGTAPTGIITARTDTFLSLASIVADEMYAKPVPIVAVERDDFERFETGQRIEIHPDGRIIVEPQ